MSIGELAQRAGVEASTIRYYEQIGVLPPARRINGRRVYEARTVKQLAFIRAVKAAGFTMAEIQALTSAWNAENHVPTDWRTFVERKIAETEAVIAQAEQTRQVLQYALACGCWDEYDMPLEAFIELNKIETN